MCEICGYPCHGPNHLNRSDITADDAIADAQDTKRHARERAERAAAGIPEPTTAELGRSLGYAAVGRLCVWCGVGEAIEGGRCIGCNEVEARRREWWAA